jgi:signal transduction histidine kinase
VVGEMVGTLNNNRVDISIEEPDTPLLGDKELLTMILTQYLDNAAKYSPADTPISVHIRESDSELILSVHNFGSAIDIQDRERVFERFYRGEDAKDRVPGTGLGLSIVKKLAESYRGHVWVVSAEQEGTTFFLAAPRIRAEAIVTWNPD